MHPINYSSLKESFDFFNVKNQRRLSIKKVNAIVANTLLDSRIRNCELEGGAPSCSLKWFSQMFSQGVDPLENQIFEKLEICRRWAKKLEKEGVKNLNDVTKEIAAKGNALSIGESLLVPGGWNAAPSGHGMLYLLERKDANLYSLYVINTGYGIGYHLGLEEIKKQKYLLAQCYKKIPKEDLFYGKNDGDFFKSLLSIQWTLHHYAFHPIVIYRGLLGRLAPYRDDTDLVQNPSLFTIGQRGGTCWIRVVKAFIRLAYFLNGRSIEEYKMWTLELRMRVISHYLNYMKKNWSEQRICLLDDMTRLFAHKIKKEMKKGLPCEISDASYFLIKILKMRQNLFVRNSYFSNNFITHSIHSLTQRWITFQKGQYISSSDKYRCYSIAKDPLPARTLSVQKWSFLLNDASGALFLLVPNMSIYAKKGFTQVPKRKIMDKSIHVFEENHTFYQVLKKEGELSLRPQTLNGKLYLAYYYLYDRRFKEFQQLLESISPADTFNAEHFQILEKILNYGEEEKHHAPEVYASILKAGLLFYQKKKQRDLFFTFSKKTVGRLEDICEEYLNIRTQIDRTLRLTEAEERTCQTLLPKSIFTRHLAHFQEDIKKDILCSFVPSLQVSSCPEIFFDDFSADICMRKRVKPWSFTHKKNRYKEKGFDFFSVYEAIRLGTQDLKTIESYLHMQEAIHPGLKCLRLALLSLAAKKKGKSLPPAPRKNEFILIEEFIQKLRKALEEVAYQLKTPTPATYSLPQEKQMIPKKALMPYFFIDNDAENFYKKGKNLPLFQQLGLEKAVSFDAGDKQIHFGRIWKQSLSKKDLKEKLEESQQKEKRGRENVLRTMHHFLEIGESSSLTIEQVKAISRDTSDFSIEQIESAALWKKERPEFLDMFKTCGQFREKAFQEDIWKKVSQYEQDAVQAIACEKALELYEKIERAPHSDQTGPLYAEFGRILETDFESLSQVLDISFLQTLIFIRRKEKFFRENQLEKTHLDALKREISIEKISIAAPLWAFKTARFDQKLPVFVVPSHLYQSFINYFKESQHAIFRQHVFTLPHFSSEPNGSEAEQFLSYLKEGLKQKQLLIVKRGTFETTSGLAKMFQGQNGEAPFKELLNFFKEHVRFFEDWLKSESSTESAIALADQPKKEIFKKNSSSFKYKWMHFFRLPLTLFVYIFD